MSSIVNLRTGLGPVLSLFGAKDRWTSPLIKGRTVPTLLADLSCLALTCGSLHNLRVSLVMTSQPLERNTVKE